MHLATGHGFDHIRLPERRGSSAMLAPQRGRQIREGRNLATSVTQGRRRAVHMKKLMLFPLTPLPLSAPAAAGGYWRPAGPGPVCMIRVEGRGGQSREGIRHHVKGRSCRKCGPGERCFTLMGPMLSGRWSCRVSGRAGRRARNACRPATPGPQWLARPGSPLAHPSRMVRRAGEWCRVVCREHW